MTESDYLQLHDSFSEPVKIVVTGHKSPDGDAVGAALGMYHYLRKIGQDEVQVIMPDSIPHFLKWMPGSEHILTAENNLDEVKTAIEEADYIFALDYNALHRTGDLQTHLENTEGCLINIDHHREPEEFAEYMLSDPESASTAELVYEFLDKLSFEEKLPLESAQCLFTGIITDTGSFKYSSTTPHTHEIAAKLIRAGVNSSRIYDRVFEQNRLDRLKLIGYVLNEKLDLVRELNTVIIGLELDELNRFNVIKGDTDGLVNYGLSVENVVLSIFVKESPEGYVKLSFRSKGNVDVNKLARAHFNGGGHINAAGGRCDLTVEQTIEKIKNILHEYEGELNSTFA